MVTSRVQGPGGAEVSIIPEYYALGWTLGYSEHQGSRYKYSTSAKCLMSTSREDLTEAFPTFTMCDWLKQQKKLE